MKLNPLIQSKNLDTILVTISQFSENKLNLKIFLCPFSINERNIQGRIKKKRSINDYCTYKT